MQNKRLAGTLVFWLTSAVAYAQIPTTSVLFQTSPPGLKFSLDGGVPKQAPIRLDVTQGTHTLSVDTPQAGSQGARYVFTAWNDGGAATHTITVGSMPLTFAATFKTQYQLNLSASPASGGTVSPASGTFYDVGTVVPISATASSGYTFTRWNGAVANGNSPSTTVTMSVPQTVIALFSVSPTTLVVTPASLTFSYNLGDAAPLAQGISVFSGGAYTTTARSDLNFIVLRPLNGGTAPAAVTVLVDTTNLHAGTFTGQVTVTQTAAPGASFTVQVTLNVSAPPAPQLRISPTRLSVNAVQGGAATHLQLAVLNSGGGTLNFSAQLNILYGPNWISLDTSSGTATSAVPGSVGITVDAGQLNPGVYRADVMVQDQGSSQSQTCSVIVSVTARTLSIELSQIGLQFSARAGGAASPPQTFTVANAGQGLMNWTSSIQLFSGPEGWLKATPASGVSVSGSTSPPIVTVSIDGSVLAPGQYFGLVHVVAAGAANSPQAVTVVVNVTDAVRALPPVFAIAGALIVGDAAAPAPPPVEIAVANLSGSALDYISTAVTEDGGNWVNLSPATGTLGANGLTTLGVQANFAGLAPGVRRGTLNLSFSDGSVHTVSIASVLPDNSAGATGKDLPRSAGTCSPRGLVPAFLSLEPNFAVTGSTPVSLRVAVVDTCGAPVTSGGVFVSYSDGSRSTTLTHAGNGTWTGTWVPGNADGAVGLVATAFSIGATTLGGQTPALQGTVRSTNAALPRADHIFDGASFRPGDQVALGSWASLIGDAFADGESQAPGAPYGSPLGVTEVRLGDIPLPLLYVNATQANALIPRNLDPNTQHQVVVQRGTAISVPVQVTVADIAPGIYTVNLEGTGQGAVSIGDTGLLAAPAGDNSRPVQRGETVSILLTGLGAVDNAPPDGVPAPADSVSQTLATPVVTMGDAMAEVQFSGLAAGLAGTYKVIAVVPDDAPSGDAVTLIVTMNGVPSNPVTIAIQ